MELPPIVKRHPRVAIVDEASRRFDLAWLELSAHLTSTEALIVLSRVQTALYRSMLRMERHPGEPDKPSDEE